MKCRIVSRAAGAFRCPKSNATATQLNRAFGELPTVLTNNIPEATQFFKDMAGKTQQEVRAAAEVVQVRGAGAVLRGRGNFSSPERVGH